MRLFLAILFLFPTMTLADFQYPEDCLTGFDPVPDPTNCSLNRLNNGEPADAEEVMENFYTLGDAIDALPTPPTNCTADQIIKWDGTEWVCSWPANASGFAFEYVATQSEYPDPGYVRIYPTPTSLMAEVTNIAINSTTANGINLTRYLDDNYVGGGWISITSASDSTIIGLFRIGVGCAECWPAIITVGDFLGDPTVRFTNGETYIIEFQ